YDGNGNWQWADLPNNGANLKSDIRLSTGVAPGEVGNYAYYSNAVPAYVEIELGILKSRTWERAKSIADVTARRQYLLQQVAKVHVFRTRVPIRNVDPQAYQ